VNAPLPTGSARTGFIFGVLAYVLWGFFPLYWPLLKPALALEILAHRIVWSLVVCVIALAARRTLIRAIDLIRTPAQLRTLTMTSFFLAINWGVYIWAVNQEFVVESALGYYINPLVIIAFGVLLLGEKLRPLQWISVSLGLIAVIILTIDLGRPPWIAFTLAISWGLYGLLKKQLNAGALEGLAVEGLILLAPGFAYLAYLQRQEEAAFGSSLHLTLLLAGAGIVTAIPLLLFNGAATRLPLTMLGLLQYLNPTVQFMIGVGIRHEPMSAARWGGFVIIWIALVILTFDGIRSSRKGKPAILP
jgi:chloramphenicol-sensitive protein RarD